MNGNYVKSNKKKKREARRLRQEQQEREAFEHQLMRRHQEQQRRQSDLMFSGGPLSQGSFGYPGVHIGFHSSSGSANGRELFQGPRGGIYHMSSSGRRVYH